LAKQYVLPHQYTLAAFDKIIREETATLTRVFQEAGLTK
jgi:hypothetical protein